MTVQNAIVAVLVVAALGYVLITVRRQINSSRSKSKCGRDCGCK